MLEIAQGRRISHRKRLWNERYIFLMLIPCLVWYTIFEYGPMYGVLMAFQKYRFNAGILGSEWIGLGNFQRLFISPEFIKALTNTLTISLTRLVVEFPVPIILAIMLTELRFVRCGKVFQTIFTLPHFLSWIILAQIFGSFLGSDGPLNSLIEVMGGQSVKFMTNPVLYRCFIHGSSIWKGAGWSSIMYMAVITNIDPTLYEAAILDGASRMQRIRYVTLPQLKEIAVVMLVLQVGRIMNGSFEQIFTTYNASVRSLADTLDTYIYRITFESAPDYSFSTAVGLFKSFINLILLIVADRTAKYISGSGLFGSDSK